jgi:hypothetical protein
VVPYKHLAAAVIGWALHEVLVRGRALAAVAVEAEVCRQTVANWVNQFGLLYVAHLTVHLPQLVGAEALPAAVPAPRPGLHPDRERLVRLWCQFLALAARRLKSVTAAELPLHVLVWLQPELARLCPAAGVFRVPLHERIRGPPVNCGV